MNRLVRGLVRALGIETVRHDGLILPAAHLRSGGAEFNDDAYFHTSARNEATRLVERLGVTAESRVLEGGCGGGRLPIGMLDSPCAGAEYSGLDVRSGRSQSDGVSAISKPVTLGFASIASMPIMPGTIRMVVP